MAKVFVVKTVSPEVPGYVIPGIYDSLRGGKARIGWAYYDRQDLRKISAKIRKGEALDADEEKAKRCMGFLTRVSKGDHLVYPHQPQYGTFAIVQVDPHEGDYQYAPQGDSLDEDFRSFRRCSLVTEKPISLQDGIVHPTIRRKLGLQGRFYQLYDEDLFKRLLEDLPQAGRIDQAGLDARVMRIGDQVLQRLPSLIHGEFPAHDLSRRLCVELFDRMGYGVTLQEGPSEKGCDLVITVGSPLIEAEFTVGLQAFSWEGEVSAQDLQGKLTQLLDGWDANGLDYGVLLTTGECGQSAAALIEQHNKSKSDRPVRLIDGRPLAGLLVEYFAAQLIASAAT